MGRCSALLLACALLVPASAQVLRRALPGTSLSAQYAGSMGTLSVGLMRHTRNERIGVGLFYGHTPRHRGGPLNAFVLKGMYTPWRIPVGKSWLLEPVQTGLFVAYWTGLDLSSHRPSYLGDGYYWWSPNFRQHLFVRAQLSHRTPWRWADRVGAWFEVNTNDLYVYSWWPNRSALSVTEILFFGTGVQVYLARRSEGEQP